MGAWKPPRSRGTMCGSPLLSRGQKSHQRSGRVTGQLNIAKNLNAANTEPGADIDFTEFPFQLLINCSELRSFFIYSHHSNRFHFGLVISDAFAPDTNIQRSKVFICEKSKESNVPMSNEGIVSPFNQRFPAIIAPSLLPRAPEAVIK